MKTAILAVYFGSRDTASMDRLEAGFAHAFPNCPVHRAFLSRRFPEVPSVSEAMQQLRDYDRVLVQAMLITDGSSYRQLTDQCASGTPLLASPNACADALNNWLPKPLVLMAHGSPHADLQSFAGKLPAGVYLAALEGQPSLDALLPEVAGCQVHLAPFLLTGGIHTDRDLIRWKDALEAANCTVTIHRETLAYCPGIPDLFAQHLRDTLT